MRIGVAAAVVDGLVTRVGLPGDGHGIAIPGLVDLQVNGYAGVDLLAADGDELVALGRALAADGVTAYQPTLVTGPPDATRLALATIGELGEPEGVARVVGAHLEGPFLSAARAGAHAAEWLREPNVDLMASYLACGCPVTTVTLAPELPGAIEVIDALVESGVTIALGHSDASAVEAHAAFDQGATTVTHLFNAMRPFAPRDPGVAGAALAREDVTVQLIGDGVHVAPESLLTAWRAARGRVALVSDAMSATGIGDGSYRLGPVGVDVTDGVARRDSGVLAGAVRPLAWGLRLLTELGVPIAEAVDAVTRTPARILGRTDIGALRVGARADVVVLDDDLAVERVLLAGERVGATA